MAPRGPSAQNYLKLTWDYPVYAATEERKTDGTAVKHAREALSADQALKAIVGRDPRPLLVVRECSHCNKTDDALLQPGADNEKVLFLSRWFHCVKLPVDVIHADHPFHALFPSDDAEHLFVAGTDGATKIPLESSTSRIELCAAMSRVLIGAYAKDPTGLYKDVEALSDQLDGFDARIRELKAKRSELMESHGTGSKTADKQKIAKLDAEIESIQKEIAQKVAGFDKNTKLPLKPSDPKEKAKESGKS